MTIQEHLFFVGLFAFMLFALLAIEWFFSGGLAKVITKIKRRRNK